MINPFSHSQAASWSGHKVRLRPLGFPRGLRQTSLLGLPGREKMEGVREGSPAAHRTPEEARIWLMGLQKRKMYQGQRTAFGPWQWAREG